ncbi:MAG TPA: ATP-binding cassette domain-containing protein [Verrucomicrobiae bacterium]|nr:ATP-binding cassette domain-containing protein [Verrucomicrobiae bacterium]
MIAVEQLQISAGNFALRDLSFTLPAGSYGVLMGRTGQGKTTLLEAICGLRRVHGGRIRLDDDDVTDWPPARRNIGFVPQDAALFAHLSVREQLGFSLAVRKRPAGEQRERVEEVAEWLGITPLLERGVAGLSGGEMQRVALGRALAFQPRVLCLDEPLSALDHETRESMCDLLQSVQSRTRVTVLHITHNRAEAERLADCVLHLNDGRIENRNA